MVITFILFFLGIFFLLKGSDLIVDGSSSLAKKLGVSTLVIGLTIVAFGTSLPELMVGIFSSLNGINEIVLGNNLGANIANVLLILGVTAILSDIKLKINTIWKQIPFALLVIFILYLFTGNLFGQTNQVIGYTQGIILLSLLLIFIYSSFQLSIHEKIKPKAIVIDFGPFTSLKKLWGFGQKKLINLKSDIEEADWKTYAKLFVGIIGIYFGGRFVVDGAVLFANYFGMSEFLISATIISIGTTLPELTISIISFIRGKVDLAVGNIIGSVIFNICAIIGISSLINPIEVPSWIYFDISILFFSMLSLFILMFIGKRHALTRNEGILFVLGYIVYIVFLIIRG